MLHLTNEGEIIALAGLLHDIGKLFNRCDYHMNNRPNYKSKTHQMMGVDFLKILEEENILSHNEILETLVQRHHEHYNISDEFRVNTLEDGYIKSLAYLMSKADNYSSNERSNDDDKGADFKSKPLDSIVSSVSISSVENNTNVRYSLNPLSYNNTFPKRFDKNNQEDIKFLTNRFLNEVKNLNCSDFNSLYNNLYHIIKKYTWCLPSDTQKKICDISLFDHLKTTSAIALASYYYHKENNSLELKVMKSAKTDVDNKFLVVGFELGNVDEYINDIKTNKNSAKRLRGKSLYVNLLSQSIAYRIIDKLNLTISNIVLDGGNKFFIIAQNTEQTRSSIENLKKDINNYLFNKFEGELSLTVGYKAVNGKSLMNFTEVLDEINYQIELNEDKNYIDKILNNPILEYEYEIGGVCSVCEKVLVSKNSSTCYICEEDTSIGTYLTKAKYIAFYNEDVKFDKKIKVFDSESMYICFCEDEKDIHYISSNPYIVLNIQATDILNDYSSGFRFYANYVPMKNEDVKTFEEISESSTGVKNLGILKLGIDNLDILSSVGLIRTKQKENLKDEEVSKLLEEENYTTISRLSTFNEMINMFLNNYIFNIFKTSNNAVIKFNERDSVSIDLTNQYVLNTTNNCITIIGPWNEVVYTAKFLNDKFKSFTYNNKDMNISCGIAFIKSKEPIMNGLKEASDNMERARQSGGNGIYMLDRYISFGKFDEVFEFAEFMYAKMLIGAYSQSFVYRLLSYTNMIESYVDSNYQNVSSLMYLSKFDYDINRNLIPKVAANYNYNLSNKEDKHKVLERNEVRRISEHFANLDIEELKNNDSFLYNYMKICLNYAVRKNRGGN